MNQDNTFGQPDTSEVSKALSRRHFLGFAGALTGATMFAASCSKDDNNNNIGSGINLGSGDTGVLNYAYALEQLEAAFYTRVVATGMSWANSAAEKSLLTDIRDHEIAHREFFRTALGSSRIQDLTPKFDGIDFTSRDSVLKAARDFEDLGVQAYNGAGQLLTTDTNLVIAGKIVSVEARHAAYIRELLTPHSFADTTILDPTKRIDVSKSPNQVLAIAGKYITETLNASNLPTA